MRPLKKSERDAFNRSCEMLLGYAHAVVENSEAKDTVIAAREATIAGLQTGLNQMNLRRPDSHSSMNNPTNEQQLKSTSGNVPNRPTRKPTPKDAKIREKSWASIVIHGKDNTSPMELMSELESLTEDRVTDLKITAIPVRQGIQIRCNDQSKMNEVQEIAKKLTNSRIVPDKQLPAIAVRNIPMSMPDNAVKDLIVKYNPDLQIKHEDQLKFLISLPHGKQNAKIKDVVFQTDGMMLDQLGKKNYVQIGLTPYPVDEHFNIKQCLRCLRVGQKQEECKCCPRCLGIHPNRDRCQAPKVLRCIRCSGNHMKKDCASKDAQCFQCHGKPGLKSNHMSLARNCPVRKKIETEMRSHRCYDPLVPDRIKDVPNVITTMNP